MATLARVDVHRRAAELAPEDAKVLSDLGFTLIEMGEMDEAESTLQRAVALDPEDERARGNLDYCRKLMAVRGRP
jgi:Flp pilus assembly protein TadD